MNMKVRPGNPDGRFPLVRLAAIFLFFSLATFAVARPAIAGDYETDPLRLGKKALEIDSLRTAHDYFEKAVKERPGNSEALYYLGETYLRMNKLDEALANFQAAIKASSEPPEPHRGVGDVLRLRGDLNGAEAEYKTAMTRAGRYAEAIYGLGMVSFARNDTTQARKYFEQGLKDGKIADRFHYGIGIVLTAEGATLVAADKKKAADALFATAEVHLIAAREARPKEAAYQIAIANMYIAKGVASLGGQALEKALVIKPNDPEMLYQLGHAYELQRRYNEALGKYKESIAASDSSFAPPYKAAADLFAKSDKGDQAAGFYYYRYGELMHQPSYLVLASSKLMTGKRPDIAVAALRKAIEIAPDSCDAYYRLGDALYTVRKYDDALAAITNGQQRCPPKGMDLWRVAQIQTIKGDTAAATATLESAVQKDTTCADCFLTLGYVQFLRKNYAAAIPNFERASRIDSTMIGAHLNLGLVYLAMDRKDDAVRAFQLAVATDSTNIRARLFLAQAYTQSGSLDQSLAAYQDAASHADTTKAQGKKEYFEAKRGAGVTLLLMKKYKDAVPVLQDAVTGDPGNIQGMVWLAQAYDLAGATSEARSLFQRILAKDPSNGEARKGLEIIRAREG